MYTKQLSPYERSKLVPDTNGRPLVRVTRYVLLPCGRELLEKEEYPLEYCEEGESGVIAVVHFREEPITSLIRLEPNQWGTIDGFNYSLVPGYPKQLADKIPASESITVSDLSPLLFE